MNHTKKQSMVTFRYFELKRSLNVAFVWTRSMTSTGGKFLVPRYGFLLEFRADCIGFLPSTLGFKPKGRFRTTFDDSDYEQRRQSLGKVYSTPVEMRKDEHREYAGDRKPDRRHELVERHELRSILAGN